MAKLTFPTEKPVYKVLNADMKSCHGGRDNVTWNAGQWTHAPKGEIRVCRHGLHVTTEPMKWPAVGMRVFEIDDHKAMYDYDLGDRQDKVACRSIKLGKERPDLVWPEWTECCAFFADIEQWPLMQADKPGFDPTKAILFTSLDVMMRTTQYPDVAVTPQWFDDLMDLPDRDHYNRMTDHYLTWSERRSLVGQMSLAIQHYASGFMNIAPNRVSNYRTVDYFKRDVRMFALALLENWTDANGKPIDQARRDDIMERLSYWKQGFGVYGRELNKLGRLVLYTNG